MVVCATVFVYGIMRLIVSLHKPTNPIKGDVQIRPVLNLSEILYGDNYSVGFWEVADIKILLDWPLKFLMINVWLVDFVAPKYRKMG